MVVAVELWLHASPVYLQCFDTSPRSSSLVSQGSATQLQAVPQRIPHPPPRASKQFCTSQAGDCCGQHVRCQLAGGKHPAYNSTRSTRAAAVQRPYQHLRAAWCNRAARHTSSSLIPCGYPGCPLPMPHTSPALWPPAQPLLSPGVPLLHGLPHELRIAIPSTQPLTCATRLLHVRWIL